jgi:hypothetical protein
MPIVEPSGRSQDDDFDAAVREEMERLEASLQAMLQAERNTDSVMAGELPPASSQVRW